jgi:hypothetical protein
LPTDVKKEESHAGAIDLLDIVCCSALSTGISTCESKGTGTVIPNVPEICIFKKDIQSIQAFFIDSILLSFHLGIQVGYEHFKILIVFLLFCTNNA